MSTRARPKKFHCEASNKRRFRDHREAVEALHGAAVSRQVAAELGQVSTRREVRSYRCTACRGWHLTSWAEPPAWVATQVLAA